jgi:hypothetical protein
MSDRFVKVPLEKISDERISDSEFRLWCAIRSFGNFDTGMNCFPSLDSISERSGGKSRSSVIRGIKGLVDKCLLSMERGVKGRSNAYFFAQPPMVSFLTPTRCQIRHPDSVISDTLPDTLQETFTKADNPFLERMREYKGKWTHLLDGVRVTALAYNC